MKLSWSKAAFEDRRNIMDWVEADNPPAARALDERIESAGDMICNFPEIGRIGRLDGTRELVVTGTPYILVYAVKVADVSIIRVLHGARQWPPDA